MSNPQAKGNLVRMRSGTKQGSKHVALGYNNQDARLAETFSILGKTYRVGLVSDGCSGFPTFSRTEVGANLLVLYAYRRIQEMLCFGMNPGEVATALFPSITEFIWNLANTVMPASVFWPYPAKLPNRENCSSQARFMMDYLTATLLGFIDDGEEDVIFTSGDGIVIVNEEITIINQNDLPEYPAISVNQRPKGFAIQSRNSIDVHRLSICSDGLKQLVQNAEFVGNLFTYMAADSMGLQYLLNITYNRAPHLMPDDCTAVTWERVPAQGGV